MASQNCNPSRGRQISVRLRPARSAVESRAFKALLHRALSKKQTNKSFGNQEDSLMDKDTYYGNGAA